jgi:hypothetical protein
MNDSLQNYGFTADADKIAQLTAASEADIAELMKKPRPAIIRFGGFLSAAIPHGMPKFSMLPDKASAAAETLGFRPVCFMRWGHWPLPMMNTPQWIGPEGFVKLESYGRARFYMNTMFTDGTAISSTNAKSPSGNLDTLYLTSCGDFQRDYVAHLAAVREHMDTTWVRPIYRPDRKLIQKSYRVFYHLQLPVSAVLQFLMFQFSFVFLIAYAVYATLN